jgi:hypothetical protein
MPPLDASIGARSPRGGAASTSGAAAARPPFAAAAARLLHGGAASTSGAARPPFAAARLACRGAPRPCAAGKKGQPAPGADDDAGRGFGGAWRLQDELRAQRADQLAATDMLAKLVSAGAESPARAAEVAAEYVDSLTEEFFQASSAYMALAGREGSAEVADQIRAALEAAFEAKNATLRPEIQLLNRLLRAEDALGRKRALNGADAGAQLTMNGRYFFGLLDRMEGDVRRSPEGPQRGALLEKLGDIRTDALARLPPGAG